MNQPLSPEMARELRELAEMHLNDRLEEADGSRLRQRLLGNPKAQALFLSYLQMHGALLWLYRDGEVIEQSLTDNLPVTFPSPVEAIHAFHSSKHPRVLLACVATAACFALVMGGSWLWRSVPSRDASIAVLRAGTDLEWRPGSLSPHVADRLHTGVLDLAAGLAQIEFDSATFVVVEGPAKLELVSPLELYLHHGRVSVRMPTGASGFVVDTSDVKVLDQGTEFGVDVALSGPTIVQVYEGQVAAGLKRSTARGSARRLTAGESLEVAKSGRSARSAPFIEELFVRQLPQDSSFPSNEPVHEVAYAVATPPNVIIDGDLRDWDWRRRFRSECRGEFGASYWLESALMYDQDSLYIGAHVGDPTPLANQIAPEVDPPFAWRGGGLHLRIAADPKLSWPLEVESENFQRAIHKRETPDPVSPQLMAFCMWNFAPRNEACLFRYKGLGNGLNGELIHDGFQGAFRRDTDGRGYVIEYALPWRLMNVDEPPLPGDAWAAIWQLHWSTDGRSHLGHLIDVCNPAERENLKKKTYRANIFNRAVTWGRIEFQP